MLIVTATHRVTTKPKFGGLKCGATSQKAVCNTKACPVNCKHSKWSAWGKCSKKCGGGTKSKTRTITQKARALWDHRPTSIFGVIHFDRFKLECPDQYVQANVF